MARKAKVKIKERHYRTESYFSRQSERLGFIAREYVGSTCTWQSSNHCCEELCESEIAKRKIAVQEFNASLVKNQKPYKWT